MSGAGGWEGLTAARVHSPERLVYQKCSLPALLPVYKKRGKRRRWYWWNYIKFSYCIAWFACHALLLYSIIRLAFVIIFTLSSICYVIILNIVFNNLNDIPILSLTLSHNFYAFFFLHAMLFLHTTLGFVESFYSLSSIIPHSAAFNAIWDQKRVC
jgi:hypothetical protein